MLQPVVMYNLVSFVGFKLEISLRSFRRYLRRLCSWTEINSEVALNCITPGIHLSLLNDCFLPMNY